MTKRILLTESDESVRKMVTRVLQTSGYEVVLATSAAEAFGQITQSRPELLLVDLERPDLPGWKPLEKLKRAVAPLPVLVMTSWPNQGEHADHCGVRQLLEKPLDMAVLLETIERTLAEPKEGPGAQRQQRAEHGRLDANRKAKLEVAP